MVGVDRRDDVGDAVLPEPGEECERGLAGDPLPCQGVPTTQATDAWPAATVAWT